MTKQLCPSCHRPKASTHCDLCHEWLCKDCAQFLAASTFSFLREIPEILSHFTYCGLCYDKKVAPELETYTEIMNRAREVHLFYKNERDVPLIHRSRKIVSVQNCPDRKETLLRLAFFAAQQSYNGLVNIEVTSEKVKTSGYQTTIWAGTGYPAKVHSLAQ